MTPDSLTRQRIDKWLWHARTVRTRSAAAALVEAGFVRLNGRRVGAASQKVARGDVVTVTLDRAVLDYASRNRESVLYDRYVMGRRNIEKGSRDNWTVVPHIVYEVNDSVLADSGDAAKLAPTFRRRGEGVSKRFLDLFRRPENRDRQ